LHGLRRGAHGADRLRRDSTVAADHAAGALPAPDEHEHPARSGRGGEPDGGVVRTIRRNPDRGALTPGPSPGSPHPVPGRGEKSDRRNEPKMVGFWNPGSFLSSCGEPWRPKGSGGRKAPPAQILPARKARPQDDVSNRLLLVSPLPAGAWGELGEGPGVRARAGIAVSARRIFR